MCKAAAAAQRDKMRAVVCVRIASRLESSRASRVCTFVRANNSDRAEGVSLAIARSVIASHTTDHFFAREIPGGVPLRATRVSVARFQSSVRALR